MFLNRCKQDGNKGGIKGDEGIIFFLNSVYIIKSMILLQFGRKTGTFCVSVDYFHQSCSLFLKVGMEIKCLDSII